MLEERRLLTAWVGANDDTAWAHHGTWGYTAGGNLLENDSAIDMETTAPLPVSASLDDSAPAGFSLSSDGSWTYTGPAGFTGVVVVSYLATAEGTSDAATLTITVENYPPQWEEWTEVPFEGSVEADEPIVDDGTIIAMLGATDADIVPDELTYWGSGSSFLTVLANGAVQVTDGMAFTNAVAQQQTLTIDVFCTDGVATVQDVLILDYTGIFDWIDNTEIFLRDSAGVEYSPDTGPQLITILQGIRAQGRTVSYMEIKGHVIENDPNTPADEQGIQLGDGDGQTGAGNYLTVQENIDGTSSIYFGTDTGDVDVTQLLNDVTDQNSQIHLFGCMSIPIARKLKSALTEPDGNAPKVYGAYKYIIGIPWSRNWYYSPL